MLAYFRSTRLFSSASATSPTLQQVGKELARAFGQKTAPPAGPSFFEFNAAFVQTVDAHKLRVHLLRKQVLEKRDQDPNYLGAGQPFNPSRYVQQVVNDASRDVPEEEQAVKKPVETPWWEKKQRASQVQAKLKPAKLIVTGTEIHFMNGFFLTRFISEGGKIYPRWRSGLTAKQQRKLAREIRKARQLGIIPVMQKFLPGFEATLTNQYLGNPLAGLVKTGQRDTEDAEDVFETLVRPPLHDPSEMNFEQLRKEARAEAAVPIKVIFGVPEIDSFERPEDIQAFTFERDGFVPEIASPNRLRFRAVDALLLKMTDAEVTAFLDARNADHRDCTSAKERLERAQQYLDEFEEHVFQDSPNYNGLFKGFVHLWRTDGFGEEESGETVYGRGFESSSGDDSQENPDEKR